MQQLQSQSTLLGNRGISEHFQPSAQLISVLRAKNYNAKSLYALQNCGTPSGQFILAQCNCQAFPIALTSHCDLSVCPSCSKRRQRRIMHKYSQVLEQVPQRYGYDFAFLTFSPSNYTTLKGGYNAIRASWKRFLRMSYVKQRVQGGIYVIEAKNPSGTWNIHIHAILYTKWLDNRVQKGDQDSKLVKLFSKASKSRVNIDIRRVGGGKRGILSYMLKYITGSKLDFIDVESHADYIIQSHKTRLITTFGDGFYNKIILKPIVHCEHCKGVFTFSIVEHCIEQLLNNNIVRKPKPKDIYTYSTYSERE